MKTKQRYTPLICYALFFILFVGGIGYVAHLGAERYPEEVSTSITGLGEAFGIFRSSVEHHLSSTIGLLLLQILVILVAARTVGALFRRIGQPAVIGEICAGIMLGPSLLGRLFPEAFDALFPASSLGNIQLLSNFGLILFMFVVGMELRLSDIKKRLTSSLVISHAGIFVPFALSLPVSYYVYEQYATGQTTFLSFALFVGIAMSITAFPVLARIVQERGLHRKPLGQLSLATAAASDITAWIMLAGIIAISQSGSLLSMVYNVGFFALYLLVMFGVIRPIFRVAGKVYNNTEVINHTMTGVIFLLLLLSAWTTELLSMHALFGSFVLGLVMPEDVSFRKVITDKVEDVSLLLFLPLFFVSSGLQTELSLIDGADMWAMLGFFTLIAIVGKVGGTYISARSTGETPRNSLYLGALMNTRGLMELVVLAIGLEMGILSPRLYVVLVLMTVITTVMTMPMIQAIKAINAWQDKRRQRKGQLQRQDYRALISFGRPATGLALSRLGYQLLRRGADCAQMTAVHITADEDISTVDAEKYYDDNFRPLLDEASKRGFAIETEHLISSEVESLIIDKLRREQYNLLIVGSGLRLSSGSTDLQASDLHRHLSSRVGDSALSATEALLSIRMLLRDKMDYFVKHAPCSVAILLGKDYNEPKRILVRLFSEADLKLLSYARRLAENNGATLTVQLATGTALTEEQCPLHTGEVLTREGAGGEHTDLCQVCDLFVVSWSEWQRTFDSQEGLVRCLPSTLILSLKAPNQ